IHYLLHYTNPGDVIIDGFSGSGMTGVAARRCGNKTILNEMNYIVKEEMIFDELNNVIGKLGERHAILSDLSPSATLISYNYNRICDIDKFENEATLLLNRIKQEYKLMYQVNYKDSYGFINNVVWSDVFECQNCLSEIIYWDAVVNLEERKITSNDIQ